MPVRGSFIRKCKLEVCREDVHWGPEIFLLVDGVETMFMYFTVDSNEGVPGNCRQRTKAGAGRRILSVKGGFATMRSIHILYDRNGIMKEMQENLKEYPGQLLAENY